MFKNVESNLQGSRKVSATFLDEYYKKRKVCDNYISKRFHRTLTKSDQVFALLNFYCNKNAIIAIVAIIANKQ